MSHTYRTVEVPVAGGRGSLDVTYFNERLEDEITSVSTGVGTYSYINQAGESTREGVELMGRLRAGENVDLRLSYTYLDAANPDGSVEVRRPKHELGLGMTARLLGGRARVSADLRHVAGNYDTQYFGTYSTVELPSYTTVDVSARYALSERVDATLRIANLFDEKVSDVWGYAGRDRTIYVGIDARW